MTDNGKRIQRIYTDYETCNLTLQEAATMYYNSLGTIISTDYNGVGDKWYTIKFDNGSKEWLHESKVIFIPKSN